MSRPALVVKAELTAELIELGETSLGVLQKAVDGLIQPVDITPSITMWVNEEGLLRNDLSVNPLATLFMKELFDTNMPIMGDVVFTGGVDEQGDTLGLDQNMVNEIAELTRQAREALEKAI